MQEETLAYAGEKKEDEEPAMQQQRIEDVLQMKQTESKQDMKEESKDDDMNTKDTDIALIGEKREMHKELLFY